jgi:geranylgeranyl reductase family protein
LDDQQRPIELTHTWDLAIVGAGPAGTAAALAALSAQPDLNVLLLDRSEFPRDKACGDGIAPQVLDVLGDVGIAGLLDDKVPVPRLRLERGEASVSRVMARPAWVVPRRDFDSRLVNAAAAAGARLRKYRTRTVTMDSDAVIVNGDVRARVLVGADGAHSAVRTAVAVPAVRRQAFALRGYVNTPAARQGQQVIVFGQSRQPSYAWSFDRGDGLANVGYGELLTSKKPPLSRELLLRQLDELLPGAVRGGHGWLGHHLPLSSWRFAQPDGPVLLAGDAAGLINPLTGEGIYYAVATGVLAGRAAVSALRAGQPVSAGRRHRVAVRSLLARHLRHTALASRLVMAPPLVDAGLRAAARDQLVFDELVEIGLAQGLMSRRLIQALTRHIDAESSWTPR